MGAELAAKVERIILSWVCSLLIDGEEKAAGLELLHLLLPGQEQCDRLHKYTFIKSIHLSCRGTGWCHRTAQGQNLCLCVLLPSVACLILMPGRTRVVPESYEVGWRPFPRSVPSAGNRTQHGALLGLRDAHRCNPIPARR